MAEGLLCVHAHPDDETITTGGVLRKVHDLGRVTHVVTCTGGEEGEIVGVGLDAATLRPRLAEVRREELAAALGALGAGEPRLLGYRDSGMMGATSNARPDAFWQASVDEAVMRVVAHIRELRPAVLVTYDAYGLYGHPDHIQAHRVALLAAEAAAMPALYPEAGDAHRVAKVYLATVPHSWMAQANAALAERGMPSPFGGATDPVQLTFGTPDEHVHATVDVRSVLDHKLAALRAHATQLGPDSLFLNLATDSEDLAEFAFGTEHFVRLRSDVPVPDREDDLFTGL